ncbi:MAG: DUF4089 domain-containing protein [Gammaproteobacteria bacterium]|nr:DUF4089 domain-containing protein [Gammaproteobacteria bacterium]MCP5425592.1 DUF4089 domain-containing protein [Gammaproteobacteria bacterium]MCP5459008.1 DUF4089 domain-containing protein [Gammaproteobacteria bacterium]
MTPEFLAPPPGFDAQAVLDTVAPALGLSIAPEHRPGTLLFLDLSARMAQFVMEFELADDLEPAPVFRP